MESKKRQPHGRYITIALICLGVLLAILVALFVREYFVLRHANIINRRGLSFPAFIQKHGPLNASEVGVIRPWMTFDYINRLFALPKDYLKDQLDISDPHYPNDTIGNYSSANKITDVAAVADVQNAIINYFNKDAF